MSKPNAQAIASPPIEELADSTPLLGTPERLRQRWREDGVLYFRDVISHAAIAKVRDEYMARLKEVGVVAPDATQPIWNGRDRLDGSLASPISDDVWRGLVSDPSLDKVVRSFLGEAPAWVPIVVHRSAPPAAPGAVTETFATRHQDGIFNYGIDFVTCWVPLMDIDGDIGGLAVAPGSHQGPLYPLDASGQPDPRSGIPAGTIPDANWRRPDYKVGDLLMFHSMTAHAGLPNRSDRLRLSTDIRFLPESVAKPVVGHVTAFDGSSIAFKAESGEEIVYSANDDTIVRGPKGTALLGDDRTGVVFPGANVIVVPGEGDHAKLVRSVSRKYIDLPAPWFETLPANWVK
jgi:hypothetical protein